MKHLALILLLCAPAAIADEVADEFAAATDNFVEANILSIFYHELGHALIDVMDLPVFGQEEDAADTASILLIDAIFEEQTAQNLATDAALGFVAEAGISDNDTSWWDEHGADLQRFYNLVCLFYGADTDTREDFADNIGLPNDRAENCEAEYDLAIRSWGPVFDELQINRSSNSLEYNGDKTTLLARTISTEVAAINAEIALPVTVSVKVEACDEANAFYSSDKREIVICTEFEPHLRDMAPQTD